MAFNTTLSESGIDGFQTPLRGYNNREQALGSGRSVTTGLRRVATGRRACGTVKEVTISITA
jgi:hypothetical protein